MWTRANYKSRRMIEKASEKVLKNGKMKRLYNALIKKSYEVDNFNKAVDVEDIKKVFTDFK